MQNLPPIMCNDEEAVQHSKRQSWHGEEVHRSNRFPMIAQKCRPSLCRLRIPRRSAHPAQDGAFRNFKAKHRKFAVDAGRSPGRVLSDDAEDELAKFRADTLPAWAHTMPRKPGPIRFESGAVPSHNGLRLDENQCLPPSRPESSKHHPEQSVGDSKLRLRMSFTQD
jgi:hypothetical protein